tara:strand:+ start:4911 stop:5207 length:297 start_codon:yes stop_codon:yes gene_type:complete
MKTKILNPQIIIKAASIISGKPINVIRGKSRASSVVAVRDLCIKLCKDNLFVADRDIAVPFGKDRSSVCIALKRVEKNLDQREQYRLLLDQVKGELNL